MVKNKNFHSFWQALIIALVIFWTGIMLGILFENSRADNLQQIYFQAETDIFDVELQSELLTDFNLSCETGLQETIKFADRIYEEARQLEKYDSSTKITDDIILLHKRYDLLRVMLWRNVIELQEKCPDVTNSVVYLYEYDNPSSAKQAQQVTFSRILLDLKEKHGDEIILIPIAYDTNVQSLNLFKEIYGLDQAPVVIINQKHIIKELQTVEELDQYLNN